MLGAPAPLYLGVAFDAAIFCALDLRLLARRSINGAARLIDHLWRMLAAMLFATFALFVANPGIFPDWLTASGLNFAPPAIVLTLIFYWVVRVRRRSPASLSGTSA